MGRLVPGSIKLNARGLRLLLCLFCVAAPRPAQAADITSTQTEASADLSSLSLDELMDIPVHAASGFEQKTADAPSSVTILTRKDLQAFGYRTLAEALSSVVGFYSTYDRTYNYLGVRGFNRPGDYNTRTLVMINGIPVNDPLFSTGRIGTDFPLDLDLVERIEIVRGPSSSLYGSSAFFAVINVITRNPQDVSPAEAAASGGSYDAFTGRFSLAKVFGTQGSFLVSGSILNSQGDNLYFPAYDTPQNNHGVAVGLDGEQTESLFLQAKYEGWALQLVDMARTKDRPTAAFDTVFNAPNAWDRDRETLTDVSWSGDLTQGWDLLARVGEQHYEYGAAWPYADANPGDPLNLIIDHDHASAETIDTEIRATTDLISGHKITLGTQITDSLKLDQKYIDDGTATLDSHETQWEYGLYAQDEIRLCTWARVNAGLRLDGIEPYGNTDLSPRTALILSPFSRSVFKFIYGEAFRAPNAYERFYNDGVTTKANPGLSPETIRTYEFVWEQRVCDVFQLNTSLYQNDINDLITQVLDPSDDLQQFQNVNTVKANGMDVEGRVMLKDGVEIRSGYSFCDAEEENTRERLSNSPINMAKINLLVPLVDHLTAGIEVQYISRRLTLARTETGGYAVANATLLSRQLRENLELSLSVYNLLDHHYVEPVGDEIQTQVVAQDGRTLRLKAVYKF